MAYNIVTDHEQSQRAFALFRDNFARDSVTFSNHYVGWQSGGGAFDVHWHESLAIWGLFNAKVPISAGKRYWNCFGTDDPEVKSMLSISVEINPAHEGINKHVAGAFLSDSRGALSIGHSGKVGGGRKGIGMSAFRAFLRAEADIESWHVGLYPNGDERSFYVLSALDDPSLAERIARFVHLVARFKDWAVERG